MTKVQRIYFYMLSLAIAFLAGMLVASLFYSAHHSKFIERLNNTHSEVHHVIN